MIKKNYKDVHFIHKGTQNIDLVYKGTDLVFEQGYTREQTAVPPVTTTYQAIGKNLKDYKIYGNSIQNGTPTPSNPIEIKSVGDKTKDLFNKNTTEVVDAYVQNGTVTAHSTCKTYIVKVTPNTTYSFRYDNTSISANPRCTIYGFKNKPIVGVSGGEAYYFLNGSKNHQVVFTTGANIHYVALWLLFNTDTTGALDTVDLREGKNYLSSIYNGYFTNSISTLTENNAYRTFIVDSLPPGTYTFSTNINNCVILRLYKDGEINSAFASASTYTFTTVTTGKVLICCRNSTTTELESGIVGQYEIGSSETSYSEPVKLYKIPVISRGKNILKPTIISGASIYGVDLTLTNDIYHLSGLATASGGRAKLKTQDFYLKAGTYRFSIFSSNRTVLKYAYFQSGSTNLKSIYDDVTYTVENDGYYNIGVNVTLDINYDVDFTLMIETETTGEVIYEKYIEPITTSIYLDEPLRKIVDYADYIDFKNGKIIRLIFTSIFTGEESWNKYSTYDSDFYVSISNNPSYDGRYGIYIMCEKYTCYVWSASNVTNIDYATLMSTTGNNLHIKDKDYETAQEFSAHLSSLYQNGTPLTIYYVLKTATEETITLPNIPTVKGTTVFEIDTNVNASNMYIKYKSK